MGWLSIVMVLLPLLEALFNWLTNLRKEHGTLSDRQQAKLNTILDRMEHIKANAVAMGCTPPATATAVEPDPSV